MIDYSKYTLGRVVRNKFVGDTMWGDKFGGGSKYIPSGFIGHIVGFDLIEYDSCFEVILKVQWCDGTTDSIHIDNVELVGPL